MAREILIALCVLVAGVASNEDLSDKPRITYSKDVVTKEGENVTLDCGVSGVNLTNVQDFTILWNMNDAENPVNSLPISRGKNVLILSNKYTIQHEEGSQTYSLTIQNMTEEDMGTYECVVQFGDDQKIHADVSVDKAKPAFFMDNDVGSPKRVNVNEGDAISIDCRPGGAPRPEVYWERKEEEGGLPFYGGTLLNNNVLELIEVHRTHSGLYTCHADNGLGEPVRSDVIIKVQYAPEVTLRQSNFYVGPDDSVVIECSATANPLPDLAFYKDGAIILSSANVGVRRTRMAAEETENEVKIVLTIREVTAEDYGNYTCRAINVVGESEKIANVQSERAPAIKKQSTGEVLFDVSLVLSRNALPVVLECEAGGHPPPEYRWTKDGEPLVWQADSRFSLEEGTGNLLMTDLDVEDHGYYQCSAYNQLGTAVADPIKLTNSAGLNVEVLGEAENNVIAEEGKPLELKCPNVTSYPKHNSSWIHTEDFKNGSALLSFIGHERLMSVGDSLYFTHVTKEDASEALGWEYVCMVSHPMSPLTWSIARSIKLQVTPSESAEDFTPETLKTSPQENTFNAAQENELLCIYAGKPNPSITWTQDGVEIDSDRFKVEDYGKRLVFKEPHLEDSGVYACTASNGVGDDHTTEFNVDVEVAPIFEEEMESQIAEVGETVAFDCNVNSTAELHYSWTLNGRPLEITPESRRQLEGSVLEIKSVTISDVGNYACNATNKLGYAYGQAVLSAIARKDLAQKRESCESVKGLASEVAQLRDSMVQMKMKMDEYRGEQNADMMNMLTKIYEALPKKKEMSTRR